jgi:hypothetical protein
MHGTAPRGAARALALLALCAAVASGEGPPPGFVTRAGTQFALDGAPFHVVGTNQCVPRARGAGAPAARESLRAAVAPPHGAARICTAVRSMNARARVAAAARAARFGDRCACARSWASPASAARRARAHGGAAAEVGGLRACAQSSSPDSLLRTHVAASEAGHARRR